MLKDLFFVAACLLRPSRNGERTRDDTDSAEDEKKEEKRRTPSEKIGLVICAERLL